MAIETPVLIVGGGYIAVEFAGIFNGFGAEVVELIRREELLYGFDDESADRRAKHDGVDGSNGLIGSVKVTPWTAI